MKPAAPRRDRPTSRKDIAAAIAIAALAILVEVPSLDGGYFWDDVAYVADNPNLDSFTGLQRIWFEPATSPQYYPAVFTSFWIENHLWGGTPFHHRLTNVLLHALNALLFWLLLRRLRVPGALLAAFAFAAHPVHVESVAWIAERKNVLSTAFYLLAVLWWLRFIATRSKAAYAAVLVAFLAALLSKTVTASLPLVLGLVTWWQDPVNWRRELRGLAPLFLLAIALAGVTVWREQLSLEPDLLSRPLTLFDRLLLAGTVPWFYLWKLVWPSNLMVIYPRWTPSPWHALGLLGIAAVLAGLWFQRQRWGAGPLVGVLFFVLSLAPVSGIVHFDFMQYSYVGDHLQYLASLGAIGLLAAAATAASRPWPSTLRYAGAVLLVAGLTGLAWRQAQLHADSNGLWRDTLARNPQAAIANYNLGTILSGEGRLDEAIKHFAAAVKAEASYADAYLNWGVALQLQGQFDAALERYRLAARLKPGWTSADFNIGTILLQRGDLDGALRHFNQMIAVKPDLAEAQLNAGIILSQQGKIDAAVPHIRKAAELRPDWAAPQLQLAMALEKQGRRADALLRYELALRLDPENREALAGRRRTADRDTPD